MQEPDMPDDLPPNTAEEDANVERIVLLSILDAYPELYSRDDLVRQIALNPHNFAARDVIDRIVRDLSVVGLLHGVGPLVVPSRAALHLHKLRNG